MAGKKLILIAAVFCLFLISACNKNEAPVVSAAEDNTSALDADSSDSQGLKKMYVNSVNGLRVRNFPGEEGERIGVLDHFTEVSVVREEGNTVTIGGASGKWTYVETNAIQGWVFGGFLSNQMPDDSSFMTGAWDVDIDRYLIYIFRDTGRFIFGIKESGHGQVGTWNLKNNNLTFVYDEDEEGRKNDNLTVNITVSNQDSITFNYPDGGEVKLTRNKERIFN